MNKSLQSKKNIIFDIGAVLIDWDPNLIYQTHFKNDAAAIERFYSETNLFVENRALDRGASFTEVLADLSRRFPHYRQPLAYWKDKWPEMIKGPITGSVAILKNLHQQNYPLFALSNWSHETFPIIRAQYDFFQLFHDIIISGEVKCIKPEPEIYQLLLNKHQLKAHECIFIDDNANNVQGATSLGIHGIVFENPLQLKSELKKFAIEVFCD